MSYTNDILSIQGLTVKDIVEVAKRYVPYEYRNNPWSYPELNHGTNVLDSEEQCNAYLSAYGMMHAHKLERAFDKKEFPFSQLSDGFELYDWGCGQGLGSVVLINILRQRGALGYLKKITLEEPSDMARSRAVLHIRQALGDNNVKIIEVSEYLPSDIGDNSNTITSIEVEQPCAVHIFSNILDIESVSLKGVSKLITSSGSRHLVICVGPLNNGESRIGTFNNYFIRNGITVFTDFREPYFGQHKNGKNYGCSIRSFLFSLSQTEEILRKFSYYAPIQLFACFDETVSNQKEGSAFEILAPFDLTAHKELCPIYALLSNLISRGYHTRPSARVLNCVSRLDAQSKSYALAAVARIQKSFVEMLISGKLDVGKGEWNILILEDETDVAQVAMDDFSEMYGHLIALTEKYGKRKLPAITVSTRKNANVNLKYNAIIDVSISKYCDPQNVKFAGYEAINDCYFIVRTSKEIYEDRTFYTTERIKYKPFVARDGQGNYYAEKEPSGHLRYFLNLIFGMDDFRPGQLPILNRAIQLKSVIGLLPTGGGKSLTYQLAAMLQPAVTLVIDPLRGLMKDQHDGLLRTGIDCISYINSDLTSKERQNREQNMTGSQILIMFLSPERLSIYRFREVLRSMRESNVYFAYGVIDEVHCVSEWGHDFRLAYLHLGRNLYNYVLPKEIEGEDNHISLFGLTATASFDVLADVERELSGINSYSLEDDATIRYENTNRLELQYYVANINSYYARNAWDVGNIKEEALLGIINDATAKLTEIQSTESIKNMKSAFVDRESITDEEIREEIGNTDLNVDIEDLWYNNSRTQAAGIVFCLRRENGNLSVSRVAEKLRLGGINSISTYKGGDDTTNQDGFLHGDTNLMVATKAFGMGIDKPNVRLTVHLNYPSSLESFVQEAGRAGRDRKMALATIMYSPHIFPVRNEADNAWDHFSADYTNNRYFYDANFLGEEFELYVMGLLMKNLPVIISNEEFQDVEEPTIKTITGITRYIGEETYSGRTLTYYINYEVGINALDEYNQSLSKRNMPIFDTPNARDLHNAYGYANFKEAVQKAIYRMCVIGLIDDFTEDYANHTFRVTTVCQNSSVYYDNLRSYYRKYYSEERTLDMMTEVQEMAKTDGDIMACLKHLTSFIYKSIAEKRARGIWDMEQFCNMAITSEKDWKETNEDLKDFIYYYFNSKYARENFVAYDSALRMEIPFSLKDDTNPDLHSEEEITSFELVRKYMRVVDPEIVNSDSQKDNVKHLQGAIRLIRRASAGRNPAMNLLNVFCILFLGQQGNEMLEKEMCDDFMSAFSFYGVDKVGEYTKLLIEHTAIDETQRDYLENLSSLAQLRNHLENIQSITSKYIKQ